MNDHVQQIQQLTTQFKLEPPPTQPQQRNFQAQLQQGQQNIQGLQGQQRIQQQPNQNRTLKFQYQPCVIHGSPVKQTKHTNAECFTQKSPSFGLQTCCIHVSLPRPHLNNQCRIQINSKPCQTHQGSHMTNECPDGVSRNKIQQTQRNDQQTQQSKIIKPPNYRPPNSPRPGPPKGSKEEAEYEGRCWKCGMPSNEDMTKEMIAGGWELPDFEPHIARYCPIYGPNDPVGFRVCQQCSCGFHAICKNK